MMNAVGGTSVHYWAQSWRLKAWDFKREQRSSGAMVRARLPQDHCGGLAIAFEDLAPFYDIVEEEIGVSGKAGNIQGKLDPRQHL